MTNNLLIEAIKQRIYAKRLTHMTDGSGALWIDAKELYDFMGNVSTRKDEDGRKDEITALSALGQTSPARDKETNHPVPLEKCAIAASQWVHGRKISDDKVQERWNGLTEYYKAEYVSQAKAVLDAAGVKYEN